MPTCPAQPSWLCNGYPAVRWAPRTTSLRRCPSNSGRPRGTSCYGRSCVKSWSRACSTPTYIPATCSSTPAVNWACWTSVRRLDNGSREALAMLMMAIDRDSSLAATDALLDLLDPPAEGLNERLLERDVGQLMARFRSGGGPASGAFRPALRFGQSAQARSAATGCGCLPHARSLGGHPTTA